MSDLSPTIDPGHTQEAGPGEPGVGGEVPTLAFICGCPRSGTTALWRLVVSHPRAALGLERFSNFMWGTFALERSLYEPERFFDCREGDTFYDDLVAFDSRYELIAERYPTAQLRGDKLPKLYLHFAPLMERIPDAKVVFIVRNIVDVALSYQKRADDETDQTWRRTQGAESAVIDWNESLRNTLVFHEAHPDQLMVLDYENFFGSAGRLNPLLRFLELDMTEEIAMAYRSLVAQGADLERARADGLTADAKQHIVLEADADSYRRVLAIATR